MLPRWLKLAPDAVTIEVSARPGAPRQGVLRIDERGPVIGLRATAERGRANDEIIALVAEIAGVTRSQVEIIRGASSRQKVLRIRTPAPERIAQRLDRIGTLD